MVNGGANITGTPRLFIGVCSGNTNVYGDATVTNAFGAINTAAAFTFTAGTPSRVSNTQGFRSAKIVGTTVTDDGATGTASIFYDAEYVTTLYRTAFSIDIIKGSPNYTARLFYRTTTTAGDVTEDQFLAAMEAATPVLTGHTYGGARAGIAMDEVAGVLDHVNLSWDRASTPFEISSLAVVRLT